MATVLKNDIHTNVAQIFHNGIRSRTTRAYFALGRTLPWTDDNDPPDPTAARDFEYETRAHIIGMRAITLSDVTFAINRVDWESGTVFDMYDDRYSADNVAPSGATDIADAKMFVITDEFNIYKCISNNYGSVSTVKPTGTNTGYLGPYEDGYIWKYMDTVDVIQRSKFLTNDYVPISNSVEGRYFQSGLEPYIIDGGTGYDSNNTQLVVQGDSDNAVFTPVIDENGQISSIIVNNPGTGYSLAEVTVSTPDVNQPQGTGAQIGVSLDLGDLDTFQADVQLSAVDGELSFIYVTNKGSGYTTADVTIDGNGQNAQAAAVINNDGQIVGITLNDRGSDYTTATVTITGDGTGATADAIIAPTGGHGRNIINESFADVIGFHTTTSDEIGQGFTLENDYRQVSVIIDPDKYPEAGELRQSFINDYGSSCFAVEIESFDESTFALDQEIVNRVTERSMYVVAKENTDDGCRLLLQSIDGSVPEVGDEFLDTSGASLFTVAADAITAPQIDKFSGSMISINNRPPFRRNVEQIVNLRTFIRF